MMCTVPVRAVDAEARRQPRALTAAELAAIEPLAPCRSAQVALEEMLHLSLVNNLLAGDRRGAAPVAAGVPGAARPLSRPTS
ncbi:MAG: ferritin-like protein [Comamonadaceae bacterium]|nr:ferritin-like protein [Comamonadaceae bacterium]